MPGLRTSKFQKTCGDFYSMGTLKKEGLGDIALFTSNYQILLSKIETHDRKSLLKVKDAS